ncbi:hypothetical protein BJP48_31655 [Paenibacillus odorifer]|nr:hypothetical protein BJP48_31655 [Paenibacillus odorifer]
MKVAIICEFSGTVRDAFIRAGHNAVSFDLLPSEQPGGHIQYDAQRFDPDFWTQFDLAICHPPCTYLTNSGVRWLHTQPGRWEKMREAIEFFKFCLSLDVPMVAIENPIMHKYAIDGIGAKYTQIIQPWQFGHGETKATCLWLKGLPPLMPTDIVDGREGKVHKMAPGPDRWRERSRTYKGIAEAMAQQWGSWPEAFETTAQTQAARG